MNAKAISAPLLPHIAIDRILYATDFSVASLSALPLVSTIARKYGSQVLIAHVWTPLPATMTTPESAGALERQQEEKAQAEARALLTNTFLSGLRANVVIESGNPVEEINEIVRHQNVDLVIVSTHGRTGFKHLLMGSVCEELFRGLPCPVLTAGPHISRSVVERDEIKHILFPTDLSDESRTVFPYLSSLAAEYKASLTVLHVLPVETATNPNATFLAEPLRKEMQNMFSSHIDPRCSAEFIIDIGDTVERILAHARDGNADLIGLGVRKAHEITTHFRNTVAYRIVLQSLCPVLTTSLSGLRR